MYIVTRKVLLRLNGLKSSLKCLGKNIFLSFFSESEVSCNVYVYIYTCRVPCFQAPISAGTITILIGFLYSIRRGCSSWSIQRTSGWLRTKTVRDAAKERKLPVGPSHGWEDFITGANSQPMHQVILCDLVFNGISMILVSLFFFKGFSMVFPT